MKTLRLLALVALAACSSPTDVEVESQLPEPEVVFVYVSEIGGAGIREFEADHPGMWCEYDGPSGGFFVYRCQNFFLGG